MAFTSACALADGLGTNGTLVVTFATSGQSNSLVTKSNGTFLGQNVQFNSLRAQASTGTLNSGLVNSEGTLLSGVTLSWVCHNSIPGTAAACYGENRGGAVTGEKYTTVFGDDIVSGTDIGGCLQGGSSYISLTISGLTAGQTYDLYMLTGRGNPFSGSTTWNAKEDIPNATYTLSGVSGLSATLLGASHTDAHVDGQSLVSYEYNSSSTSTNWALVKWSFTATDTDVTISANNISAQSAKGNINAFALQATTTAPAVPEPATATLSLLALAGLCARRRRK